MTQRKISTEEDMHLHEQSRQNTKLINTSPDPDVFRYCHRSCHLPQGPWPILAIVCITPSSILRIFPSAVPVKSTSVKTTHVINLITNLLWQTSFYGIEILAQSRNRV